MSGGEAFKKSREALVGLISARKLEERRRKELLKEFERWENRAKEAESSGDLERARGALAKCSEIAEQDAAAKAQILRLNQEIEKGEKQLRDVAVRESRSVNAEALLASLEAATGEAVDPEKKKLDALSSDAAIDEELSRLKERLREEDQ